MPQSESDFGEFLGKDVASTTVSGQGTDTLDVQSNGSYPSYGVICGVTFENDGVAPSLIDSVTLTAGAGLTGCSTNSTVDGNQTTKELACAELTARFTTVLGIMLPPNGSANATLVYHTEQRAPEDAILAFSVDLRLTREDTPTPTTTTTPQNQILVTPTSTATQPGNAETPTQSVVSTVVQSRVENPTRSATSEVAGISQEAGASALPRTGGGSYENGSDFGLIAGLALIAVAAFLFYLANRTSREDA